MKTTKQILQEARALVAKGWVQGEFARLDDGTSAGSDQDSMIAERRRVCAVCVEGALILAGTDAREPAWGALMRAAGLNELSQSLHDWNDTPGRTQDDVLSAFDKAIAACDAEVQS